MAERKRNKLYRVLPFLLVLVLLLSIGSPMSVNAKPDTSKPVDSDLLLKPGDNTTGTGSGTGSGTTSGSGTGTGGSSGSGSTSGGSTDTGGDDASSVEVDSSVGKGSQWVDRDASGIYDGSIGQYIKEEDPDSDGDSESGLDTGDAWYVDLINTILTFIPNTIADFLYGILKVLNASLDNLIYGRLVSDKALFTFGLENGNIYGIVSSLMYNTIRSACILIFMMIFMGKIAMNTYLRSGAFAGLKEPIISFATAVLLVMLMPYLLDVGLFIRDCLLYMLSSNAGTYLFGDSSTSIVGTLRDVSREGFINSLMYLASVVLNGVFLLSYVGVALAMVINFILFPFVVIKSFFDNNSVLSKWVWEMVSCALVPVIDAVLIMIPVFVGVFADYLGMSTEKVAVAILQVLICMAILPAREAARNTLGLQTNPLERTGLGASAFVGAMAARGIGGIVNDFKEAGNDRKNAEMEEELANIDNEENGFTFGGPETSASAFAQAAGGLKPDVDMDNDDEDKKPSLDENLKFGDGEGSAKRPEDFQDYDDETPFGQQQSYGDNVAAYQAAMENYDADEMDSNIDKAMGDIDRKLEGLKRQKDAVQSIIDNPDTSEEGAELAKARLEGLEEEEQVLLGEKGELENLRGQNNNIHNTESALKATNAKLAGIQQKKADITERYERDPESYTFDQYSEDMRQLGAEEKALTGQKRRLETKIGKEMLNQEASVLKSEYNDADSKTEELIEKRQGLVRERNALQAKQDTMTGDSEGYRKYGENIAAKNEEIRKIDSEIGECESKKSLASRALQAQQNELRDRQAYNLGERAKAQQEYDKAAEAVERYKNPRTFGDKLKNTGGNAVGKLTGKDAIERQEDKMEAARQRLAAISVEDARINEKLQEYDPQQNQYTLSDLQKAKGDQQIRKAKAQSKIAVLNAEIGGLDPANLDQKAQIAEKRRQIVKLTAESADANLQAARFDQMISGMKENGSYGASMPGKSAGRNGVSNEYDQKRRAILERYANIDNFEQPQFADISRERRAQLLRQRALHRRVAGAGKIVGAVYGAGGGMFIGAGGMAIGGMVGAGIGGKTASGIGDKVMNVRYKDDRRGSKPVDIHVSSDLHGNSVSDQNKIIEIVGRNYGAAMENNLYATEFEKTFSNNAEYNKNMRTQLLRANNITGADSYSKNLPKLRRMAQERLNSEFQEKEIQLVERCAGAQYVNLSEASKRRIAESIRRKKPDLSINEMLLTGTNGILPDVWDDSFLQ